jgi:hypothetical protein
MQFLQSGQHGVTVGVGFATSTLYFRGDLSSLRTRWLDTRERNFVDAGVNLGAAQE